MAARPREGENRLFTAIVMLLERKIQRRLPPGYRGIHAPVLDRSVLRERIEMMLNQLAGELADEVREALPRLDQVKDTSTIEGRYEILTNDKPCDECGVTRRVSVVEYEKGELKRVECERCAPEFKNGGTG